MSEKLPVCSLCKDADCRTYGYPNSEGCLRRQLSAALAERDAERAKNRKLEQEQDAEIARWQNKINALVADLCGHAVDGSGCDSGDELDLTLAEIREGFGFTQERQEKALEELADARMHMAAMGEITGPKRGVVEDVEDLRLRCEKAEAAGAACLDAMRMAEKTLYRCHDAMTLGQVAMEGTIAISLQALGAILTGEAKANPGQTLLDERDGFQSEVMSVLANIEKDCVVTVTSEGSDAENLCASLATSVAKLSDKKKKAEAACAAMTTLLRQVRQKIGNVRPVCRRS